jgi:anti-sigma-K factor RskA
VDDCVVSEHDELVDSAALYALGALDPAERRTFEAHLQSCTVCAGEVRALRAVADRLAYSVTPVDPPAGLRGRLLRSLTHRPTATRGGSWGWLAAAAMLAVSIGLGWYAVALRERIRSLEQQVADALRSSEASRVRLAVLTAPDLADVTLKGQAPAPQASGRALWSRSRGLVFAASALPAPPAGRTYQLWYLTSGPPISAGIFEPEADGRAIAFFATPQLPMAPSGFAVSLEPDGGVPAPTGAIYLAGQQ